MIYTRLAQVSPNKHLPCFIIFSFRGNSLVVLLALIKVNNFKLSERAIMKMMFVQRYL